MLCLAMPPELSDFDASDILHRLKQEFGDIQVLESIPDEDEDEEQIEEDGVKSFRMMLLLNRISTLA